MVQVAESPGPSSLDELGEIQRHRLSFPTGSGAHGPFALSTRSESLI